MTTITLSVIVNNYIMSMPQEFISPAAGPSQGYFNSLPQWARKTITAAMAGMFVLTLSNCSTEQGCAVSFADGTEHDMNNTDKSLQQAIDEVPGVAEGNCRDTVQNMAERQVRRDKNTVKLPGHVWAD